MFQFTWTSRLPLCGCVPVWLKARASTMVDKANSSSACSSSSPDILCKWCRWISPKICNGFQHNIRHFHIFFSGYCGFFFTYAAFSALKRLGWCWTSPWWICVLQSALRGATRASTSPGCCSSTSIALAAASRVESPPSAGWLLTTYSLGCPAFKVNLGKVWRSGLFLRMAFASLQLPSSRTRVKASPESCLSFMRHKLLRHLASFPG